MVHLLAPSSEDDDLLTRAQAAALGGAGGLAYATTIGNGSTTDFTVNHNLGTEDVIVGVWDLGDTSGAEVVSYGTDDANNVSVDFDVAPDTNSKRVVVFAAGGSPVSVDHGGQTGLGDDDHTQYLNEARHDADDHSALTITESQVSDLDHTDVDAIHDNVAGEIAALGSVSAAPADHVLIEDASDSNNKRRATAQSIADLAAAPPSPASSVVSETAFGASSAVGTGTAYARNDHTHGSPTNPITAHEAAGDPHTGYMQESVIAASGMGYVNHGATAGAARPSGYAAITWFGSVEPTNAVNGDVWVDTS